MRHILNLSEVSLIEDSHLTSCEVTAKYKGAGRVLVVEDNEFNIEVVRCMLENAGHTVGLAMNGQDGLEAWNLARQRGDPYDVILMVRASSPTFRALSCPPFPFFGLLWPSHALLWPSHALL